MKIAIGAIFLLFVMCSFFCGIVFADTGEKEGEKRWSFAFDGCPAADAFRQIEEANKI